MIALAHDHSKTLELVAACDCEVGEGPFWDPHDRTLVFVESFSGTLLYYRPTDRSLQRFRIGQPLGAVIPRVRGGLVGSSSDGLLAFDKDGSHVQLLVPVEKGVPDNRMNDAKCDSRGRLWVGTFSTRLERDAGRLYRIDSDLAVTEVFAGVHISNGFAWNPEETLLYFNDTGKRLTYVFDYEIETGAASNPRVFLRFSREEGMPDGMCADAQGCLWIAFYGGSVVRRYSPQGELIGVIHLPVKAVTSCCFGGSDFRDLYITTAWHEPAWVKPSSPRELAGSLFCCRLETGGLPAHRFSG